MTRGKYAAKAAKARAEDAQETVAELRQFLAEERARHAQEVIDLKTKVQQLSGQISSGIQEAARAEVRRVNDEWAATLMAERHGRREAARAVGAVLRASTVRLQPQQWGDIAKLLNVSFGELTTSEAGQGGNRTARRLSSKDMNLYQELTVRGIAPDGSPIQDDGR